MLRAGFDLSASSVDCPHSRLACVFFIENSSLASFVSNAFEYFHHTRSDWRFQLVIHMIPCELGSVSE
jgi:hypothetical protein